LAAGVTRKSANRGYTFIIDTECCFSIIKRTKSQLFFGVYQKNVYLLVFLIYYAEYGYSISKNVHIFFKTAASLHHQISEKEISKKQG